MIFWARALGLATLIHVSLPDFAHPGWIWPGLVQGAGGLWLLVRPHPAAFGLVLAGQVWTLLALRDVLTQSMYLGWCAAIGLVGALRHAERATLATVRALTAGLYLLAALHKLNTDFFRADIGCGAHAWHQVVQYFNLPEAALALDPIMGALAWGMEVALVVLIWRGHPLRWPLAAAFHLPLTVTLAPAFAAVTLSGYVAAGTAREAVLWRQVWRQHRWALIAGGVAIAGGGLAMHGAFDAVHGLKMAALGMLAIGGLEVHKRARRTRAGLGQRLPLRSAGRWVAAAWLVHGLLPYTGIQYQHTAAMLSNLRVDPECHNSLVMPEAMRVVDRYIRIDEARFADGQRPKRARRLVETLWNVTALHTMRRNWCVDHLRPIRLTGSWRGRLFLIEDLCADDWAQSLSGGRSGAGVELLPQMQVYQKNLPRACHQACIH